jgi:hypothetical protein
MKLYTEEQLRDAIKYGQNYEKMDKGEIPYVTDDEFIKSLNPIKLPSDEDIEDVICPKCKGVNEYSISNDGNYRCAYTDCRYIFNKQLKK